MFLKVLTQRYLCFIMYNLWISDIQPWLICPFCFHLFIYFSHCFMTTKIEPNQRWGQCSASYPIYSFIWSADNSIRGAATKTIHWEQRQLPQFQRCLISATVGKLGNLELREWELLGAHRCTSLLWHPYLSTSLLPPQVRCSPFAHFHTFQYNTFQSSRNNFSVEI